MAKAIIYLLLLSTSTIWSTTAVSEVTVEFDMTDRQVTEGDGPCDVTLGKAGKLSADLSVRVRALTIEQYENLTGTTFTEDVPHTEESDFDSSYEQVFTFEANGGFRQRKPVEVSVVEDNVNEKSEEFLLFFDVVDPSDSVFINTLPGRNPVRCRIRNNDDIQVGFESSEYTVDEGSDLESQVFITKFDGVSTEEDIDIQITVIPQTTQIGSDYTTPSGGRKFDLKFASTQTKIGIPITLLSNSVSETNNREFYMQFTATGADDLMRTNILTRITIKDTTPPSPSPSTSISSPTPSLSLPALPEPDFTVVHPLETSVPVLTNLPQLTAGPFITTVVPRATDVPVDREDCEKEEDEDLALAIGLTFLATFLLTALIAAIIIVFVVIADRRRRENRLFQQQLS